MIIRKKDFQRTVSCIQDFLDKLSNDDLAAAELRDSFNFALWQMQNYYKILRTRSANNVFESSPKSSILGLLNPFIWKWLDLEGAVSKFEENYGFLRIHSAAKEGNIDVIGKLLTEEPLSVNYQDCIGRSPLMYCAHYATDPHSNCLNLLLSFEANTHIKTKDNATILHYAAYGGNSCIMETLLKHEAQSINYQDNMGRTSLHLSVMNNNTNCLKLLLEKNAAYSLKDIDGLTPLMWACHFDRQYHMCILQSYYESEYNNSSYLEEERDNHGRTAIHWAAMRKRSIHCLQSLLTCDSVALTDNNGHSVLHTAALNGSVLACEFILEHHPEVINKKDNKMQTALHLATLAGHGDVVNFLLQRKAIWEIVDNDKSTPIDLAISKNLHYCSIVFNSYNLQGKKGHSALVAHKSKVGISGIENKSNALEALHRTRRPRPLSPCPLSKPRSYTSPHLVPRTSEGFLESIKEQNNMNNLSKTTTKSIDTQKTVCTKNIENGQKTCDSVCLANEPLSKQHNLEILHHQRSPNTQPDIIQNDNVSLSSVDDDLGIPIPRTTLSLAKEQKVYNGLGNSDLAQDRRFKRIENEMSIAIPYPLANSQKLPLKSPPKLPIQTTNLLISSPNDQAESHKLTDYHKESLFLSVANKQKYSSLDSNSLLNKTETPQLNTVKSARRIDTLGTVNITPIKTNINKIDNSGKDTASCDNLMRERNIAMERDRMSDQQQNLLTTSIKREKSGRPTSPNLLAPISRLKSRSFSGLPSGYELDST